MGGKETAVERRKNLRRSGTFNHALTEKELFGSVSPLERGVRKDKSGRIVAILGSFGGWHQVDNNGVLEQEAGLDPCYNCD